MAEIFISYRRQDAGDIAGRVADRLKELPQVGEVFLDVESIGFGENFVDKINNVIECSDICLLLIGPQWHGPREGAAPRIMEDEDFVRMEASAALKGSVRVIPVLLHGADMPQTEILPPDLTALPYRIAFPLRTAFFSQDVEVLFDDMFGKDREKPGDSLLVKLGRRVLSGAIWGIGAAALLLLGVFVLKLTTGRSLNEFLQYSKEATTFIMIGIPLAGVVQGFWMRERRA